MNRREASRRRGLPRWGRSIALGAVALAVAVGGWSLAERARGAAALRQAREIGARLPALPLEQLLGDSTGGGGRRGRVRGHYDRDRTQLIAAARNGTPGARVITPLFVDPDEDWALLVDRGWIPTEEIDGFRERDGAARPRELYGRLESLGSSLEIVKARLPYPVLAAVFVREPGSDDELPVPDAQAGPPAGGGVRP